MSPLAPENTGIFMSPLAAARRPFSDQTPAVRRLLSIALSVSSFSARRLTIAPSRLVLCSIKSCSRAWLASSLHSSKVVVRRLHNTLCFSALSYSSSSVAAVALQKTWPSLSKAFTSPCSMATRPLTTSWRAPSLTFSASAILLSARAASAAAA